MTKDAGALLKMAFALFVGLVLVYHADRTVLEEGDAVPNMNLPLALLHQRSFSFSPEDYPAMFDWRSKAPLWESEEFYVQSWNTMFGDKTATEWREAGNLDFNGPRYHLVESTRQGVYVSTFGPIPGLTLLPLVALVNRLDPELSSKPLLLLTVAKLHASVLVAAAAALLFWAALALVSRRDALIVALVFAVGTCAWSIASQNIWQQTTSIFFLCAGAAPFLRAPDRPVASAVSGMFFGLALSCRPTSIALVGAVVAYRAIYHRRSLPAFLAGLAPAPILIGIYNTHFFGSPWVFAQSVEGHRMAEAKTGSANLWQTPFTQGLAGLLISPSRGLLLFSPVLAFGIAGMIQSFEEARFRILRPLLAGAAVIMAVQCKWFDWWGGWAYGYRPWLDAIPFLSLSVAAVIEATLARKAFRALFAFALAWSVAVQALGAFAYDKSWNDRVIYVARLPTRLKPLSFLTETEARDFAIDHGGSYIGPSSCNIDLFFCRHRLWSVSDSMLIYYARFFGKTRRGRYPLAWRTLGNTD